MKAKQSEPNTPKLSEDVEKDLVGENEHSVYTYCLNGCRTWGVNTPLNNVCGNCNQPDGLVYYDLETITKYVNKELATLKAQVRREIEEQITKMENSNWLHGMGLSGSQAEYIEANIKASYRSIPSLKGEE